MSLSIALAGKPNTGKSTFFKAATLTDVEIANYPFTTINANRGISHVRTQCPCDQLSARCGYCIDGVRFVPVELVDVAGLVPEAHKGRGLGNAFLDNLRQSEAVINVVDASGGTDIEGNVLGTCSHDPLEDVRLLENELSLWIAGIVKKNWLRLTKRVEPRAAITDFIAAQLSGLNINEHHVKTACIKLGLLDKQPASWSEEDIVTLAHELRKSTKPIVVAANKIDVAPRQMMERVTQACKDAVPTSGAAELALRLAHQKGVTDYVPGNTHFHIIGQVNEEQRRALERLQHFVAQAGTGVQACLNKVVFDILKYIVVFPVEDENRLSDKEGRILPDAFLIKAGQTTRDLAFKVHSDIGKGFIYAVDARTKKRLGEHHVLEHGDIIKIVTTSRTK